MRSATIAEWPLSLVTPPDRAASSVGDLLEETPSHGALWFWSCVLRTTCSHLWADLSDSPGRTVGLAFWGFLANWWFAASLGLTLAQLASAGLAPFAGVINAVTVLACTAIPLLVGWEAARRSRGRELAAAFGLIALFAVFNFLRVTLAAPGLWPGFETLAQFCALALSTAAGAILYRRRSLTPRGTLAR